MSRFSEQIDYLTSIKFKKSVVSKEPKRAVFFLHGYGSNMEDASSLMEHLSDLDDDGETVYVFPNGIEVADLVRDGLCDERDVSGKECDVGARQWFELGDMDVEVIVPKLEAAGSVVLAFIKSQLKEFGLEEKDAIVGGFSQGAILASHIGVVAPEAFGGVLSCSGAFLPIESSNGEGKNLTPYTIIHGMDDSVVPQSWSAVGASELKRRGNPVMEFYIKDMGHEINKGVIDIIKEKIRKLIKRD